MRKTTLILGMAAVSSVLMFSLCTPKPAEQPVAAIDAPAPPTYGGYESAEKWGEHLVVIGGCDDCHTPKKMTDKGPVPDMDLRLSGHPANLPAPDVDGKEVASKGLIVTNDLTVWVGPWGTSFTANITSDPTGIGNWQEENFIRAIREGKLKGLESGRPLLPPMPWENYKHMTDDELKAVFAFLKSTKPINNIVPQPVPPSGAKI